MTVFNEDDIYFKVIRLIDLISINTKRHVERRLKPLNMTYPQLAVLMLLHSHDGVSQRELADLGEMNTTNLMVVCDSLEKRGWIRRTIHESDRRINRIYVTDVGKKVYQQARDILGNGIEFIRGKTPTEELTKVYPFLAELAFNTNIMYKRTIEEQKKEKSQ